jgi:astacin
MPEELDLPAGMFLAGQHPREVEIPIERLSLGEERNVTVTTTVIGDRVVYEGDIVLGKEQEVFCSATAKGIVIKGENFRWPGGVVPWVAEPAVKSLVMRAIRCWEERTPIRFPPRTSNETDFIHFRSLDGCWSHVGRQGGGQEVSLGTGCGLGAAIHEIGHALGLWHEQSRADRDQHIKVLRENIAEEHMHNFDKHVLDGDDIGAYDFGSIMHYPETAFSKNGQPTIRTLDGQPIGQRNGLSRGDIAAIRAIYRHLDWSRFDLLNA